MRSLGVDPGITGALAVYDFDTGDLAVTDMPTRTYKTRKRRGKATKDRLFVDGCAVRKWLEAQRPDFGTVESVHSFGKEGRASLAKFLTAFGVVLGAVQVCLQDRHTLVTPPNWKRKLGLIGKSKAASHKLACRLFPKHRKLFTGPRGGLLIDRAEAALIAYSYSSG